MILSKLELAALLAHVSKNEDRYYMEALRVVEGCHAEATGLRRFARLTVGAADASTAKKFFVPRPALEDALKSCPKRGFVVLDGEARVVRVYATADTEGTPVANYAYSIDDQRSFPDLDKVSPKCVRSARGVAVDLDPDYLADACLAVASTERFVKNPENKNERVVSSLEFYPPKSELDPVLMRCEDLTRGRSWTIVLATRRPAAPVKVAPVKVAPVKVAPAAEQKAEVSA